MDVSLDVYFRNIRMFYTQLIKGHKQEQQLNRLFKNMLENETRKWRKGYVAKGDVGPEVNGAHLLAKLKEQGKGGKDKKKINVDVLFASPKIENMLVFGFCYLLLENKNAEALQFFGQGIKQPLSQGNMFTQTVLRKVSTLWDKMQQIVTGKRKIVRFERQLTQSFKDMPQPILDIFYKVITHGEEINKDNIPKYLEQVAKLLHVRIDYFELSDNENLKHFNYAAENKFTIRFGLFTKEKIFGYVSKTPEKQEVQINKEVTLNGFAEISEVLNSMYATNLKEYMGLSNLKVGGNRLSRSDSMSSNFSTMSAIGKSMSMEKSPALQKKTQQFGQI